MQPESKPRAVFDRRGSSVWTRGDLSRSFIAFQLFVQANPNKSCRQFVREWVNNSLLLRCAIDGVFFVLDMRVASCTLIYSLVTWWPHYCDLNWLTWWSLWIELINKYWMFVWAVEMLWWFTDAQSEVENRLLFSVLPCLLLTVM